MGASSKWQGLSERIVDAFAAGYTIPEIAFAEEVGPSTVQQALRGRGIAYPGRRDASARSTLPQLADVEWLRHEYATKTGRQIAQELGCSGHLVFEALQQAGISRRSRCERGRLSKGVEPWSVELLECIAALYLEGKTTQEVAEALNLGSSSVYKQLREWGINRSIGEARALKNERRAGKA